MTTPSQRGRDGQARVAIIGDVGGHWLCLEHCLRELGVDIDSATLPNDLIVVQVGDLVGSMSGDERIVRFVDHVLTNQPSNWVQLIGNWEVGALQGVYLKQRELVQPAPQLRRTLQRWVGVGRARPAIAVRAASGAELLVTHAGVGRGFWARFLQRTANANAAAFAINRMPLQRGPLDLAGQMVGKHCAMPGPIWASATEVWTSWISTPMPFHQVHGHTNPCFWGRGRWNDDLPPEVRSGCTLNDELRHTAFEVDGMRIVSVDPGLGRKPRPCDLQPVVLRDAEVLR